MSKVYIILLLSFCLVFIKTSNANFTQEVRIATNQFSLDLLKSVLQHETGNAVVSPVSIYTLLAILQQGSGGTTREEVNNVVHAQPEATKESYRSLITEYQNTYHETQLKFATRAFGGSNFQFKPDFKQSLVNDFHSDIDSVDFSVPANATAHINSWVSEATQHKIPQLFSGNDLTPLTELVLVNAVYFKSFWENKFYSTPNKIFSPRNGVEVQVPSLEQVEVYKAGECPHIGAKFVHMSFQDTHHFTLLLILPTERHGLDNVVNHLTAENLTSILSHTGLRKVTLQLPKFKLNTESDLIPVLQRLGLNQVFQNGADLSGISEQQLVLSKAIQKAEIEATEHGVTAAAATGFGFNRSSGYSVVEELEFIADHPFLFFIVDTQNHVPLFAGKLTDPSV